MFLFDLVKNVFLASTILTLIKRANFREILLSFDRYKKALFATITRDYSKSIRAIFNCLVRRGHGVGFKNHCLKFYQADERRRVG